MQNNIIKSNSPDSANISERDMSRFKKMSGDRRTANLLYISTDEEIKATFFESGHVEDIICLDINFIDSEGVMHTLTQDSSTLHGIHIFFSSNHRILVAYELLDKNGMRFCSWGYKKSSAHNEKLFAYFKTKNSAYMLCVDAQHPEHQFFLLDDDTECYNPIQNLYQFLKSIVAEGGERYEDFS